MKFKLEFDMDNDSMQDSLRHPNPHQIKRALTIVSNDVMASDRSGLIQDDNGNTIGKWEIVEDV